MGSTSWSKRSKMRCCRLTRRRLGPCGYAKVKEIDRNTGGCIVWD